MQTEPTIRLFTPQDRSLVEAFFNQMGGESRAFFNRGDCNRKWALKYFEEPENPTMRRWMAELDGQMVGYVFLWDLDTSIPWLGIAVADTLKGKGFGSRLLETAKAYAIDQGKGGVLLTTHLANLRGQGLYERNGYKRMGIHDSGEILYLLRF